MTVNILVTAAGCPGFITVCKAIRSSLFLRATIHGCDISSNSIGLKFADKSFVVPRGDDIDYIPTLIKYCTENNIRALIPCSDPELLPLSRNIEKFREIGCEILVSPEEVLKIALDKCSLFNFLSNNGFANVVPVYGACSNIWDFENQYAEIKNKAGNVCVKPSSTHGSRGFRVITDRFSKEDFFNKKSSGKEITYSTLHNILAQGEGKFPELMVMEYLPGDEFSVDCIRDNSSFFCVTRRRDAIKDGICSSGETIEVPELISLSRQIYDKLGLKHNTNIQFRYNANNEPKILEINPRLSGTLELCRGAGINFVDIGLKNILQPDLDLDYKIKWGVKMQRVWEEVFFDGPKTYTMESVKSTLESKK